MSEQNFSEGEMRSWSRGESHGDSAGNSWGFVVSGTDRKSVDEPFEAIKKQIENLKPGEICLRLREEGFIDGAGI